MVITLTVIGFCLIVYQKAIIHQHMDLALAHNTYVFGHT